MQVYVHEHVSMSEHVYAYVAHVSVCEGVYQNCSIDKIPHTVPLGS